MENFVVSARKYRPATFDTVVGQEHITTTLRNAIRTNHLAQAFLFCGPRGVGKTTCARILAKTINCTNLTAAVEACDQCDSCRAFNQSASFNIHELDAASNNSVEDIRNLIDQVRYPPQSGRYKIYIIDEVHMLSSSAFNAFLKTLEEPPSYAIFILATTEKHKILPTILSRCQIFDFNRIQPQHIAKHLADIAQKEQIVAEPEALELIAQKADGGLRDALSMFDLNVTFAADRTLRYKEVLNNLHILDYDYYFTLTQYLLDVQTGAALLCLDEILRKGFDAHQFVVGLTRHFRDLLVCKDAATVQLLIVTEGVRRQYLDQATRAPMSFLLSALSIGGQCDLNFKAAKDQRLHVELALLKLANLRALLNWETLPEPTLAMNGELGAEKKKSIPLSSTPTPTLPPAVDPPSPTLSIEMAGSPMTTEPVNGYYARPSNSPAQPATMAPADVAVLPVSPRPANSRLRSTSVLVEVKPTLSDVTVETVGRTERVEKPFNLTDLQIFWANFSAERLAQTGSPSEQVLLNRTLRLDGTTIRLGLENSFQVEKLNEMKHELLGYLRQQLQNSRIQLESEIVAGEVRKMAYTAQDKFMLLATKNPALHELRKTLGLEFDY